MRCFGDKGRTYHCKVVLLDEQELIQEVQDATTGQDLLDVVLQHLNLLETAYFGLRFLDPENHTHWLDPTKRLMKQLKGTSPFTLYFSVKFYAADPTKLVEEITRYQFFLQVKQDILQGRLPITLELAAELGAYAVQSELGDYDPRRHSPGYVSEFRFIAGQTVALETKIAELHKKLVGQVPAKAELNYLEKVKWLEMYGVDLHPVLGEDNIEYFLGLTPSGAIVLRNKTKVGNYFWPRITKVYFRGRFFMLRVRDKNNSENTYGFETPSRAACKHLWQCCVEHHAFFRLTQSAGSGPQAVFSLGSKFRYSGRTEKEVMQEARSSSRQQPEVTRTPSRRYQRRVVEGAVDTPRIEDADPKIEPRVQMPSASAAPLATSNVYRSTSMTLNGRGPSSPRSIRSAPQQASSSSSVPPIGRTRLDENKSVNRVETRSESRGPGNRADSPRSVRSAAPAIAVDSRMSRRTSSVDSQSSIDSRGHRRHRRRSRCRSSDGESEVSSKCSSRGHRRHHHRHKHHHRHHSDDSSEHQHKHKHRRHRHKSSDSTKKLVESDEQWARVQAGENQVRGKTATLRDLSSRSGYAPSVDTENDSQQHSGKRRHRKHRSRSRSPNEAKNSRYPAELRQHIDYSLKDTNGLTEAELRDIPYTRVETATNVKTKFATTGPGKKHKSPRRSKSNSSDRKLAPPDGESPPPSYQDSTKKHHHHSSSRKKNKSSSEERKVEGESRGDPAEDLRSVTLPQNSYPRIAPSGESSTPPPPPSSVPPSSKYDSNVTPAHHFDGRSPVNFPGYIPNTRGVGGVPTNSHGHASSFSNHEQLVTSSPSVKNLVTGNGFLNSNGGFTYHGPDSSSSNSFSSDINCSPSPPHPNMADRRHPSSGLPHNSNGNDQYLRNDYAQGIPNGYASNRTGFIQTSASFLKPSTLERGTRGSSINKPQPSPQSSVTSGISVGGSSVSTSAESPLTAASPKPNLIQTSDLSTSSPSSSSPPPNDRDNDHVFYNPCNSIRAEAFFNTHTASDLCNSSNLSGCDSTLDDSHDTGQDSSQYVNLTPPDSNSKANFMHCESTHYSNTNPYAQHSTNILIRYHDSDRSNINSSSPAPVPIPRSSVISSVLSNDSSTHIVQSYGPAYANTYFPSNVNQDSNCILTRSSASPSLSSANPNHVRLPALDSNSNVSSIPTHSISGQAYSGSPGFSLNRLADSTSKLLISCDSPSYQETSPFSPENGYRFSNDSTYGKWTQGPNSRNVNGDDYSQTRRTNFAHGQASGNGWQTGENRTQMGNSNTGPHMLKENNREPSRNSRGWTNSIGRTATGRPAQNRQRSDGPSSSSSSNSGSTSSGVGHRSSAGSLELILGPLIKSALQHQQR